MKEYLQILKDVKQYGYKKGDRTGTGTTSLFGVQARFSLKHSNLPVVTTKRIHLPSVIHELLWMLRGDTNIKYLKDNNVRIWNEWADEHGELGPVYGKQWRRWEGKDIIKRVEDVTEQERKDILYYLGSTRSHVALKNSKDQIADVIEGIKRDPEGRRHIVSSWHVTDIDNMALPPCHLLFQFYLRRLEKHEQHLFKTGSEFGISCQLYQRSADCFLGVPFNITFYSLLTHMVAAQTRTYPLEFIWTGGDVHIYDNHKDQVNLQLTRAPYKYPKVRLAPRESIFNYTYEDIEIMNYEHHPLIPGKVAV